MGQRGLNIGKKGEGGGGSGEVEGSGFSLVSKGTDVEESQGWRLA